MSTLQLDSESGFRKVQQLKMFWSRFFCSDFRNESNGIFVHGWFFAGSFFISFKRYCCPALKFEKNEKNTSPVIIFHKTMGV